MNRTARRITITTRLGLALAAAFVAMSLALSVSRAAQTSAADPARSLRGGGGQPDLQHLDRALDVTGAYTVYLPFIARTILSPTTDLLYNGGFENEFQKYRNRDRLIVALGWTPWVTQPRPTDVQPEYKRATLAIDPLRVHGGESAQQYFSFWSTHIAGVYQRVMVPANAHLIFSAWGHAWSSEQNAPRPSVNPTNMHMRVGVDPQGGIDPLHPRVVWSDEQNAIDDYAPFSVEADAQGGRVTVFLYSAPDEPRKHNDVYWDDARLVALAPGGEAPREPNPDAAIAIEPGQPQAGGTVTMTVSSATPLAYIDLHVLTPAGIDVIPPYAGDRQEGDLHIWEWTYVLPSSGHYQAVFLADGIAPAWADVFVGD